MKTVEVKVGLGAIGAIGIGSYAEREWIVDRITAVTMDEYGITVICDCVHEGDAE